MLKRPMTPFDTYKEYLAFKNHFTREKHDYHKYGGRLESKDRIILQEEGSIFL